MLLQYKLSYHDIQTSDTWITQQLNFLHYTGTDVFTSTESRLKVVSPTRLHRIYFSTQLGYFTSTSKQYPGLLLKWLSTLVGICCTTNELEASSA